MLRIIVARTHVIRLVACQTKRNVESMCMHVSARLQYLMTTYRYRSHDMTTTCRIMHMHMRLNLGLN